MNVIEQFASSLAELRTEDIPAPVRRKLELHVVDTTGAWLQPRALPKASP